MYYHNNDICFLHYQCAIHEEICWYWLLELYVLCHSCYCSICQQQLLLEETEMGYKQTSFLSVIEVCKTESKKVSFFYKVLSLLLVDSRHRLNMPARWCLGYSSGKSQYILFLHENWFLSNYSYQNILRIAYVVCDGSPYTKQKDYKNAINEYNRTSTDNRNRTSTDNWNVSYPFG